jgi:hypothetical protein
MVLNIFYLHEDPRQCAEWMVDKHVVKMILETAQLLSTAHRVIDGLEVKLELEKDGKIRKKTAWVLDDDRNDILYNATHVNHPSAIWCRQSVSNYNWLVDHLFALGDEYRYRYGKTHLTITKLGIPIASPPLNLKEWDMTPMPSCMDEQYKIGEDPIANYRNYYKYGKASMHKWKNRPVPEWIN